MMPCRISECGQGYNLFMKSYKWYEKERREDMLSRLGWEHRTYIRIDKTSPHGVHH
jgi:hypothetical protein